MGDYDISEFAYERTIKLEQGSKLLEKVKSVKSLQNNILVTSSARLSVPDIRIPLAKAKVPGEVDKKVLLMNTSVKLNSLIRLNSREETKLVISNLPSPYLQTDDSASRTLIAPVDCLAYLDALTEEVPRMLLIKGTGTEVITSCF